MSLNSDYLDMLSALSAENSDFLIVGSYAMAVHGYVRTTNDIDIWIRPTQENARRVWRALIRFGAPLLDLTVDDLSQPDVGFQVGLEPRRIDLLTTIAGVEFDDAWDQRHLKKVGEMSVPYLSHPLLIQNKLATGRPRDKSDADWLCGEP